MQGIFGSPKVIAGLPIRRLLEIAWKMGGPHDLFDQLLPLVESSQLRCQLAKRFNRHRIVINVRWITRTSYVIWFLLLQFFDYNFIYAQEFTSNKDRLALLQYRDSIVEAGEIEYINSVLKVSVGLYFHFHFYCIANWKQWIS